MFGTIIEHEGSACYKIEKGGKIVTYLIMTDKKTKKDVVYESNLQLDKVRDLTEMEINPDKHNM